MSGPVVCPIVLLSHDPVDACDMNPPPTDMNFQHSSVMISMATGVPASSKVPCIYRLSNNKTKHWQSLWDICDDYCVYTT